MAVSGASSGNGLIIHGNARKPRVVETLVDLVNWSHGRDRGVWLAPELESCRNQLDDPSKRVSILRNLDQLRLEETDPARKPGVIVSLGGDGALLRAIHAYRSLDLPLIGVNLGAVGFNASVEPEKLIETLDAWEEGRAVAIEHMQARARHVRDGRTHAQSTVFNEIALQREDRSRMIQIELIQGDRAVCTYFADGLVVATPAGSTAYNLSAGGPIVHPGLRAFVAVGLGSFSLSRRPIVLPPEPGLVLVLTVQKGVEQAIVQLDGREHWVLKSGERLEIEPCEQAIRIINPPGYDFFQTLRHKLRWNEPIKPLDP